MTHRAKTMRSTTISADLDLSRQISVSSSSVETTAIEKLTEVMNEFMKASTSRCVNMTAKGGVIPVFDPENREQDIESWCRKVDELREIFKWSEDAASRPKITQYRPTFTISSRRRCKGASLLTPKTCRRRVPR